MKMLLIILFSFSFVHAKTTVQIQSFELNPVSSERRLIQICSEFECETLGSSFGYTDYEIQEMLKMNTEMIKKWNKEKWMMGITLSILGSYLYRWGKFVFSASLGIISFPQLKSWDEKIRIQEALQQRPQLLSDGNYQLTPEAFSLVKEALREAVNRLEKCLIQNELYYGERGFDFCRSGPPADSSYGSPFVGSP